MASCPGFATEFAANLSGPTFQTAHAHRCQIARLSLQFDLNASPIMLSGREEKGPIDEWVSIKNAHQRVTKHTGHFVQLVTGQIGQDKDAGLVVANAAFILHFDVVRVDFLLRQNIKGAVIHSPRKNTASRIMSGSVL